MFLEFHTSSVVSNNDKVRPVRKDKNDRLVTRRARGRNTGGYVVPLISTTIFRSGARGVPAIFMSPINNNHHKTHAIHRRREKIILSDRFGVAAGVGVIVKTVPNDFVVIFRELIASFWLHYDNNLFGFPRPFASFQNFSSTVRKDRGRISGEVGDTKYEK